MKANLTFLFGMFLLILLIILALIIKYYNYSYELLHPINYIGFKMMQIVEMYHYNTHQE